MLHTLSLSGDTTANTISIYDGTAASGTPMKGQNGSVWPVMRRSAGRTSTVAVTNAEIEKGLSSDDLSKLKELRQKLKSFDAKKPGAMPVAMGMPIVILPPPLAMAKEPNWT